MISRRANKRTRFNLYESEFLKRHELLWFLVISWSFMQGQRLQMITGLPRAWRRFKDSADWVKPD